MSKAKYIASAGIIATGAALSGLPQNSTTKAENTTLTQDTIHAKEIILQNVPSTQDITETADTLRKRTPQKVYHRFEDIPEISDREASLYNRNEYTYIVNADTYQKTGEIKLKRVLTAEVTKANALSLIYRSECQTYEPKKNEDQLSKYVINLRIMSKTGTFKGPSQMDDHTIQAFFKYLAADPESRTYILPFMESSDGNINTAAEKLEHKFFDENGNLRPMDERDAILHSSAYAALKMNNNAWQTQASLETKNFITLSEAQMSKRAGRAITLSNTTKNYLSLIEKCPSEDFLKRKIEDFNLAFYQLGRAGKTKHVAATLARSMNLKDNHGNLDATRIPTYAIAAAISSINWKGNGKLALHEAQNLRNTIAASPQNENQILQRTVKNWVTGKGKRYGIDELSQLNIITPEIINQYCELELSGARNFAKNYQKAVEVEETKIHFQQQAEKNDSIKKALQQNKNTKQNLLQKGHTLILTVADFIRER